MMTLQWRHNEHDNTGVSIVWATVCSGADYRKHQRSASLAFVRGIEESTGGFHSQWASNAENVSIWWRHHDRFGVDGKLQGTNILVFRNVLSEIDQMTSYYEFVWRQNTAHDWSTGNNHRNMAHLRIDGSFQTNHVPWIYESLHVK